MIETIFLGRLYLVSIFILDNFVFHITKCIKKIKKIRKHIAVSKLVKNNPVNEIFSEKNPKVNINETKSHAEYTINSFL